MTVCIATAAEKSVLIGVSDRMLTAGDVEFEPAQAKMWQFSSAIFALVAGDLTIQTEILSLVDTEIKQRIAVQPDVWVAVKDVAELYCKRFREVLRSRAEAEILHPLGLDLQSFLARQGELQSDFVSELAQKLSSYQFDSQLETLFLGHDHKGPDEKLVWGHIYRADGDKLSDYTNVGFAAIGIGRQHAESQFMFSGHWNSKPFHETLLLAYAAKKRAEVAPGVGKDTDMLVLGPALGSCLKVEEKHIAELENIYQKSRTRSNKSIATAQAETKIFVEKVRAEYAAAKANAKAEVPPATQSISETSKPEK